MTSLSIIIPTKNSSRTLPKLLKSIDAQSTQPDEVILIDNFFN